MGAYGVGLFCVLSGYLITSILLKSEKLKGKIEPVTFLQRRCLRILPAYYALLLPCWALMKHGSFFKSHQQEVAKTVSELPQFLTFTHNLGDGIGINHLWTISIEEQFYCALPLLLIAIQKPILRQAVLLVAGTMIMPYALLPPNDPHYCNAAFIALITGTLTALNSEKISDFLQRFSTITLLSGAAALCAISIFLKTCPYGPLYSIACAVVIWLAVTRTNNDPKLRPLAYVGKISYGVYLVQMPLSLITYWFLDRFGLAHCVPLTFSINTIASILVGALSFELFEKQILKQRDTLNNSFSGRALGFLSPALICIGIVLHLTNFTSWH